jgi:hypothetical protein
VLASVPDAATGEWMYATGSALGPTIWWIGYDDRAVEGSFTWLDGSPSTWTDWASGEPNDYGGTEDCTMIGRYGDATWNDTGCGETYAWICAL